MICVVFKLQSRLDKSRFHDNTKICIHSRISWSFLDSPSDGVYHMYNKAFFLSGNCAKRGLENHDCLS